MKRVRLSEDVDYHIDEPEIMQPSLSAIASSIHASSPFEKDLSLLCAQYLLYDFELSLDEKMIQYKSCQELETDYYKIKNLFKKYRYPVFCSRSNVTEFDVLIKLSTKNHPHRDANPPYNAQEQERFMITAINVVAPDECTEPFEYCICWVFNEPPDGSGIYNQRLDIHQLEYDQSAHNERDETKPVVCICSPKVSELTTETLPFGIIGKYVLFKFMAKTSQSENVDVQYCGIRVCRI
eukprot:30544_1